jgi:chromosome segregation ATPase
MNSQDATNISNEQLGDYGGGLDDPGCGPPDKSRVDGQAKTPQEEEGGSRKHQSKDSKGPLKGLPLKEQSKITKKTVTTTGRKRQEAVAKYENIVRAGLVQGQVAATPKQNEGAEEGGDGIAVMDWEEASDELQETRTDDGKLMEILRELKSLHDANAEMQQRVESLEKEERYWIDRARALHDEVANHKRENTELKMKFEEFGKYIEGKNDWERDFTTKIGELEDKMFSKAKSLDEKVYQAVQSARKAQLAAEETTNYAAEINSKVNRVDEDYEDKLGKIAVAMDNRFRKYEKEIKEEMEKFGKGVEEWKRDAAVVTNRVKQAEEKVAVTANTQKQVAKNITRQMDSLQQNPWQTPAHRKWAEVVSKKVAVQIERPEPPKESFRVRILDPIDLKEQREARVTEYADNLCALYPDEKPAVCLSDTSYSSVHDSSSSFLPFSFFFFFFFLSRSSLSS